MEFQNDACLIANATTAINDTAEEKLWRDFFAQTFVNALESILSARLSDETFHGLVKYAKGTMVDAPITDIHAALVSSKNCVFVKNRTWKISFRFLSLIGICLRRCTQNRMCQS